MSDTRNHFDAGSIAFASFADADRATALFTKIANELQSERLKNDQAASRIEELEGALRDFVQHAVDSGWDGPMIERARELLK